MTLDVQELRKDFPILSVDVRGRRLVYLDSAATSQKPKLVVDTVRLVYDTCNANIHRGIHAMAEQTTARFEQARAKASHFINSNEPAECIFTRGTTEGINLVAYSYAQNHLTADDAICITVMEHHSNLVPWHLVAKKTGCEIRAIPMRDDFTLDLDAFDEILADGKVKIVSVTHMSNVLGTINPIADIAKRTHAAGAVLVVDGAQAAPHLPVDVQALGCDFYAFSGHKMCAPTGIGILWGRRELLENMEPFLGGGEMINEVWVDRSTYQGLPHRFEAGTMPIAQAIGLGAAIEYLREKGMDAIREHEIQITGYALEKLSEIEGITIYGPTNLDIRGGAVSFNVEGIHPHDMAQMLDQEGVAIRAGHHCAQPLMKELATASTCRASFYLYTLESEIDTLCHAIRKAQEFFGVPTAGS